MTWAVKVIEQHPNMETGPRFVLLIMANRADEEGYLFPSVRWIMERTKYSERSVRAFTKEIITRGLMAKSPRTRDDGGQSSNDYRLAMSQYVLRLESPGAAAAGGVATGAPGVGDGAFIAGKVATVAGEGVHPPQWAGAPGAPLEVVKKDKKETRTRGRARPPRPGEDYNPPADVVQWVKDKGYGQYLALHVEKFRLACGTQRRRAYEDLDKAFMNCVVDDWGRVRFQAEMAARRGGAASVAVGVVAAAGPTLTPVAVRLMEKDSKLGRVLITMHVPGKVDAWQVLMGLTKNTAYRHGMLNHAGYITVERSGEPAEVFGRYTARELGEALKKVAA